LRVSLQARGSDVQPGPQRNQSPGAVITFYDERRAAVGETSLGQLFGTFEWQEVARSVSVPVRAREAVIRIGLLGATGELSLDHLGVEAVEPEPRKSSVDQR
jgi:protein-L-isoaspartate(D-aspartate) O-methyltransferase